MSIDKLLELKIESFLELSVANHEYDTQIKQQIDIMKKHISFFDVKKGYFKCYGPYGVGLAEKKEATLFNTHTREPLKYASFRKHIYAVHSALVWAVIGYAENPE